MTNAHKIRDVADVDKFISAEFPGPSTKPLLYQTITRCMIHGPYGSLNQDAPCMKDNKCNNNYLKPFKDATTFDKKTDTYTTRETLFNDTCFKIEFRLISTM